MPSVIHWHGLILPNDQDGVPVITQPVIPPKGEYHYYYKLIQSGTYFMHSHVGFQHQEFMSAPYIIKDPNDPYKSDQDVDTPGKWLLHCHMLYHMAAGMMTLVIVEPSNTEVK